MSNINICQIDPEINFAIPINEDEFGGDSLDTINLNFSSLNIALSNLTYSADNFWNPFFEEFNGSVDSWISAYETVIEFSAGWENAVTVVEEFSGAWLTPISIVYPFPFDADVVVVNTVRNWVRTNFPVTSGSCINYLEGQKMYIYTMEYAINNQVANYQCSFNTVNMKFTLYYIESGSGQKTFDVPKNGSNTIYRHGLSGVKFHNISPNFQNAATPVNRRLADKYVGKIVGIELCVQNGKWLAIGIMPGYSV